MIHRKSDWIEINLLNRFLALIPMEEAIICNLQIINDYGRFEIYITKRGVEQLREQIYG